MQKIIVGNWKMNGARLEAASLTRDIVTQVNTLSTDAQVVLCPPFVYLSTVHDVLKGSDVRCGGQDCHEKEKGAYTGNVSAGMLADIGCEYVILGHSERREYHNEMDADVRQKAEAAIAAGLKVVLCVGERLEEREAGCAIEVIRTQLDGSMPENATPENVIIGYEPVWAIGTGKIPTLEEIEEIHSAIIDHLGGEMPFSVIYGGSVKSSNAVEILAIPNVAGALVGGASLNAQDFVSIIKACY